MTVPTGRQDDPIVLTGTAGRLTWADDPSPQPPGGLDPAQRAFVADLLRLGRDRAAVYAQPPPTRPPALTPGTPRPAQSQGTAAPDGYQASMRTLRRDRTALITRWRALTGAAGPAATTGGPATGGSAAATGGSASTADGPVGTGNSISGSAVSGTRAAMLPPTPAELIQYALYQGTGLPGEVPLRSRLDDCERLYAQAWSAYERSCLLAAVWHWGRERLNCTRRRGVPAHPVGPMDDRLLARHADGAGGIWLPLLRAAGAAFRDAHRPGAAPPPRVSASQAASVVAWTCAQHPPLVPTAAQRRLRAVLRGMHGAVNESLRVLEDARALRIFTEAERRATDPARTDRAVNCWPDLLPAPRMHGHDRRWQAALDDALTRTLRWTVPGDHGDLAGQRSAACRRWRGRRNVFLTARLTELGLLSLLPPEEQRLLGTDDPADLTGTRSDGIRRPCGPRGAGRTDAAVQAGLDRLYCLFQELRYHGYLVPNQRSRGRDAVRTAENVWSGLVGTLSAIGAGFQTAGFGEPADARVGVSTYNGHSPSAWDVIMRVDRPLRPAQPTLLYLGEDILGDDPGTPTGWYAADGWRTRDIARSSPPVDLFTKLVEGYFDGDHGFANRWRRRCADLLADPATASAVRAALAPVADRTPLQQYRHVYEQSTLAAGVRTRLMRSSGADPDSPRHPRVDRFLAALFFREVVTGAAGEEAAMDRMRAAIGAAMFTALRDDWATRRPAGWSAAAWTELLRQLCTSRDPVRSSAGETAYATGMSGPYQQALVAGVQQRLGSSGEIPPELAAFAGGAPGAPVAAARAAITAAAATFTARVAALLTRGDQPPSSPDGGFHHAVIGALVTLAAPGFTPVAPPDDDQETDPETFGGFSVDGPRAGGAQTSVVYAYRLLQADNPQAAAGTELWVQLDYRHLRSVDASAPSGDTTYPDQGFSSVAPRVVGRSGVSGNPSSPHTHVELLLWLRETDATFTRPIGVLSMFDFLQPLPHQRFGLAGDRLRPPPLRAAPH
ncbi:hypothetical protein F4553_001766 [Allocatelliglobosispora scoriae]|uniref:Uncharacterized protein n=1 Tax=Allocatelliglobosispora scoriae TaxID=643052 RepID=A0A841BH30_9ACTN|nr:hypothetical protein [Allocatelliglobosispora scoriae]MBB5868387.1 hypothetical protein [Allocatelliglobosispora scoriae]